MASAPGKAALIVSLVTDVNVVPLAPTSRIASGRSLRSCTKTGWRRRLPPKNMRLPMFLSFKCRANSEWLKGAVGFTRNMKPNQEVSVRLPVESQANELGAASWELGAGSFEL